MTAAQLLWKSLGIAAVVPAAYATSDIPVRVWTDPKLIAKEKEIHMAKCAFCHGPIPTRFRGHAGPDTPSEHPALGGGHAGH